MKQLTKNKISAKWLFILLMGWCVPGHDAAAQTLSCRQLPEEVKKLEQQNDLQGARDLLHSKLDDCPEQWFILSKHLINLNEKLGLYTENLALFNRAHQKACFYFIHPRMPAYAPYLELPGFDSISARDLELRKEANRNASVECRVQLPASYETGRKYPAVFLFHGGGSDLRRAGEHWQVPTLDSGFIRIYLQSYRHFDLDSYGWGTSDEKLDREVCRIRQTILEQYPVDSSRMFAGGISAGATAAIDLALRSILPVKGVIAYNPDIPSFLLKYGTGLPAGRDTRIFISTGENDPLLPRQQRLMQGLDSLGIACRLETEAGRGHGYPKDESRQVRHALEYFEHPDCRLSQETEWKIREELYTGERRGLSIGILDPSGNIACHHFGRARAGSVVSPTSQTIYEVGSVSKMFTTVLYASLVLEGRIDRADRVEKYIPEISNRRVRRIRLNELATHQSGLPAMPVNLNPPEDGNPVATYSVEDFLDFLNEVHVRGGKQPFSYSNCGTALLGMVLERATGLSFDQLLQKYITDEQEMSRTLVRVPSEMVQDFSDGSRKTEEIPHWDIFNVFTPAGGMRSCTEDLVRFLLAYTRSDKWTGIRNLMEESGPRIEEDIYAATGWLMSQDEHRRLYWINGSTGGFSAFLGYNPVNGSGLVVLSNSNREVTRLGLRLLKEISDIPSGQPATGE